MGKLPEQLQDLRGTQNQATKVAIEVSNNTEIQVPFPVGNPDKAVRQRGYINYIPKDGLRVRIKSGTYSKMNLVERTGVY